MCCYFYLLGGYAEQARIAAQKAMDAKTKADEAKRKIEIILNKLPQDLQRAKDIPKFISEVNSIIHDTQLKGIHLLPLGAVLNLITSIIIISFKLIVLTSYAYFTNVIVFFS